MAGETDDTAEPGSVLAPARSLEALTQVNGQIQYGSARDVTFGATPAATRRRRLADPGRFAAASNTVRPIALLLLGFMAIGGLLAAVPRTVPTLAVSAVLGGAWLVLVLALTLPSRAERAGEELARRLGRFRHAVNAVGDSPSRGALEDLIAMERHLELREQEISEELSRIRASLDALTLRDQIARGQLPVVAGISGLAPGDQCHFAAPVRFGRRRADQFGHLLLTGGWLKYRGALDISVGWSEVADVQRAGSDLIVSLQDSTRALRFCCQRIEETARAGILAEYLAHAAREDGPQPPAPQFEATA